MSMDQADLVKDLKASLLTAAKSFTGTGDADFIRHLDKAAAAMTFKRPRTGLSEITLSADLAEYSGVPSDLAAFKFSLWGLYPRVRPWDQCDSAPLPRATVSKNDSGARVLILSPPPTLAQIQCFGAAYKYYYFATHVIGTSEAQTTIAESDRALLLLRAQAEAMKELAVTSQDKPVNLRGGSVRSGPKNSKPSALYQALLQEFKEAA